MYFQVVSLITNREMIATGNSIQEINRLRKIYGKGNWKKVKGICRVKLEDKSIYKAEVHWYESHGIGRKEMKIKLFIK